MRKERKKLLRREEENEGRRKVRRKGEIRSEETE
jgi:hypothetical protein